MHITLDPCTGLAEQTPGGLNLVIRPNPAHGKALITVAGFQGKAVLTVTGLEGRSVYSSAIDLSGKQSFTEQLDVSAWPKGIYIVKLQSDDVTAVARLIVQ